MLLQLQNKRPCYRLQQAHGKRWGASHQAINSNHRQICSCIRWCKMLAYFLTLWDCVCVCVCMSGTEWQCDSLGPGWPPSGLFSCCWLNAPGSVNIDKCALQERLPPCSSHMPQTNEFLKTASIKPQARSIDHRVDFISAAERGFGTHIASTRVSCQAAFYFNRASRWLRLQPTNSRAI